MKWLQVGAAATGSDADPASYARALDGLQPEAHAVTRGAKDSSIYQAASPAVVLIVTEKGLGSGVLISMDGKIVTNLHVVGDSEDVGVIFKPTQEGAAVDDSNVHRAKVLRRDEVSDLALIQVSEVPAHVKPLTIAAGSTLQVGADVHAIGHPTGQAWTYTRGIVSQIRRDYDWATESRLKHHATVIQTQTPINPGNSGGPLLDDNGQVVGINSFKGEGEGLNFAVSAEDVRAFLARTGDRTSERVAAAEDCEAEALDERPSTDPKGVEYMIDDDCDGQADYQVIEPTDGKEPVLLMMDDDGDGKIDTVIVDQGRDGQPDVALYDTDGDGQLDFKGLFRRGEDEPYRYEKVEE
jgi:S1-C subfamily serine protease